MRTFMVAAMLFVAGTASWAQGKKTDDETAAIKAKLAEIKAEQERLNKVVHCRETGLKLKKLSQRNAAQAEDAPAFLKPRLQAVAAAAGKLAGIYEVLAAKYENKADRTEINKLWTDLKAVDAEYHLAERQLRFMRDLRRVSDQLKRYNAEIDAESVKQVNELVGGIAANERKLRELKQTYEKQSKALKADSAVREENLKKLVGTIWKQVPAAKKAHEEAQAKARAEAASRKKAEAAARKKAMEAEREKRKAEAEKQRAAARKKAEEAKRKAEEAKRQAEAARQAAEEAERKAKEAAKDVPPVPKE